MAIIVEKLFGSEETASSLQALDEELRIAIEDVKKIVFRNFTPQP